MAYNDEVVLPQARGSKTAPKLMKTRMTAVAAK
jgi:hypothetical protein